MLKHVRNTLLRRGVQTAVQVTTDAAATATSKSYQRVFAVQFPLTVFIRASHVDLKIQYQPGNEVELFANLRASFGWQLVAEQDEAGIYIVLRRKPVVGALSTAHLKLIVPPQAHLALHLTPGNVRLVDVNGKLSIPAASEISELTTTSNF